MKEKLKRHPRLLALPLMALIAIILWTPIKSTIQLYGRYNAATAQFGGQQKETTKRKKDHVASRENIDVSNVVWKETSRAVKNYPVVVKELAKSETFADGSLTITEQAIKLQGNFSSILGCVQEINKNVDRPVKLVSLQFEVAERNKIRLLTGVAHFQLAKPARK